MTLSPSLLKEVTFPPVKAHNLSLVACRDNISRQTPACRDYFAEKMSCFFVKKEASNPYLAC